MTQTILFIIMAVIAVGAMIFGIWIESSGSDESDDSKKNRNNVNKSNNSNKNNR